MIDRRSFLKAISAGSVGAAIPTESQPETETDPTIFRHKVDREVVGDGTPLVFDPAILDIVELELPSHTFDPTPKMSLEEFNQRYK